MFSFSNLKIPLVIASLISRNTQSSRKWFLFFLFSSLNQSLKISSQILSV